MGASENAEKPKSLHFDRVLAMVQALATADRRLACHGRECGGCEGGGSGRERVLIRYMAACRARAQGWCALCLTLRGFGAGLPPPPHEHYYYYFILCLYLIIIPF